LPAVSCDLGQVSIISEYGRRPSPQFTLKSPWPGFVSASNTPGMITSKAAVEVACTDAAKPARECSFNLNPVGAGPFVLEKYSPKDSINLKRNPTYWAGPVHLDGLRFVTLACGQLTTEA
jgi:peptide/nickel transport system substrate-binding protein